MDLVSLNALKASVMKASENTLLSCLDIIDGKWAASRERRPVTIWIPRYFKSKIVTLLTRERVLDSLHPPVVAKSGLQPLLDSPSHTLNIQSVASSEEHIRVGIQG